MSAFLRCAACGSPRVMMDEKSEGYSLAKGILGTALIGNVGVVAGINGKKKSIIIVLIAELHCHIPWKVQF